MVAYGMSYWNLAWWMSFFPGLAIFITVLGLNFLGDGLRDAFDTRLQD
jgi:ABC-type dipeptide/oligopeptide/nickel transport system permease subunit